MGISSVPVYVAMSLQGLLLASWALAAPIDGPQPSFELPEEPTRQPPALAIQAADVNGNVWARDPRLQHPDVRRASHALEAGQVNQCIEHLKSAAGDHPAMPPAEVLLAYLYLAESRWREGLSALESAAASDRNNPEIYASAGQLALMQGRNLDASVHFDMALRLETPASWPDEVKRRFSITCLRGLATIAERRADWQGAESMLRQWVQLDPDNAQLLDRWGKSLWLIGKSDEALTQFTRSHKLDPKLNPPELSIAALHASRSNMDEAKQWYTTALEKYPEDARVFLEFGGALLVAGQHDEAQKMLDQAQQIVTDNAPQAADISLMQGLLALTKSDFKSAERYFDEVLKHSPGHAQALRCLPLVLVEQEDQAKHKRAQQIATFQARRFPGSAASLSTLGWVHFRTGEAEGAEQCLRRAAALSADGDTLFFLAQVLVDRGDGEDAKRAVHALEAKLQGSEFFPMRSAAQDWIQSVAVLFE